MTHPITRRAVLAGGASMLAVGPVLGAAAGSFAETSSPYVFQALGAMYAPLAPTVEGYRRAVLSYAMSFKGKTVGGGECTDFVQAVLNKLQFPNYGTNWGQRVDWIDYGVILQWYKAKYTSPDGNSWFGTDTQHTAFVVSWDRKSQVAQVIHQNWGVRKVTVDNLNLGWKHTGSMEVWVPWH